LDGENIPLSEVVELARAVAISMASSSREVRQLQFVLFLQGAFLILLLVIEAGTELLVEEVNVA
jgi:hypothetical protein